MAINEITKLIEETVTSEVFGVWFLIGAALVFFMQAGFAMVETGFTRAKNAGNIIMKNLMDFCIGTVVFVLLGFGLMMAEDYVFGAGNPMGDQNSADAVNQIFQSAGGIVDFVIMPENIDQFVRRNIPVAECNQILQKVP